MSESFYEEMQSVLDKHRQADAERQRDEQTEQRFSAIDKRFDDLGKLIEERLPKTESRQESASQPDANPGEDDQRGEQNPPPEESEPEINVERVKTLSVPRFYTGPDEPDVITYIDADTGEDKVRKGRKKNRITNYDVEIVAIDENPEIGQPQEPGEAA